MNDTRRWLWICLLIVPLIGYGQDDLGEQLKGKDKFEDIAATISAYTLAHTDASNPDDATESEDLHWLRWAYWMSSRLGPHGEFVDISKALYHATKSRQQALNHATRLATGNWTLLGPDTTSHSGSWFSNGIGLGRIDRIAFHPTQAGTIYVGTTAGGLWKTTNYGSTWTPLTSNLPSQGISGIVVSHDNPDVIYVLTGDGDTYTLNDLGGALVTNMGYARKSYGVFKSTDGGMTWSKTGPLGNDEGIVGYQLVQSPTDPLYLLAATEDGLYVTNDGGANWTHAMGLRTYDVAFKPDGTRAYAVRDTYHKFWVSGDGGQTWGYSPDLSSNTMTRLNIAVTPADPDRIYVLAGPHVDAGHFEGIWASYNSGINFEMIVDTPNVLCDSPGGVADNDGALYTLAFAASAINADHLVTGSFVCWRSVDAGETLQNITPYWEDDDPDSYVHADVHDMAYNPLDDNVYASSDGGLYRSTDNGTTWTFISAGVSVTQFYHMAGTDADVNKLLGAGQDDGIKFRQTNTTDFTHVICCDGFDVHFDNSDNSKFIGSVNATKHRFWNSGQDMDNVTPGGDAGYFFTPMLYHNANGQIFFIGSADIWKTINWGDNYTNTGASGSWAMAAAPSLNSRFFAAGGANAFTQTGEFYKSDNTGDSWTMMTNPASGIKLTDIAVDPTNADHVWVTVAGFTDGVKVYYSANAGSSWTSESGSLPNIPVNCVAVDQNHNVYIGTDIGVYCLPSGDSDWTPFYNGLPNVPVTDLVVHNGGSKIRASTFGRGMWESGLYTSCISSLSLAAGELQGDLFYETSNFIQVSVPVTGGVTSHVVFRGGNNIVLQPGFEAKATNYVHAKPGPCGSGLEE